MVMGTTSMQTKFFGCVTVECNVLQFDSREIGETYGTRMLFGLPRALPETGTSMSIQSEITTLEEAKLT